MQTNATSTWDVVAAVAACASAVATAAAAWAAWAAAKASKATSEDARRALGVGLRPTCYPVQRQVALDTAQPLVSVGVRNGSEQDAVDLDVEVKLPSRIHPHKDHLERLSALEGEDQWDVVLGEVVEGWPPANEVGTVMLRWSDAERIHRYEVRSDLTVMRDENSVICAAPSWRYLVGKIKQIE